MSKKDLKVTSGAEWRAGELVELPSGKVARLRKPDVLALISENGEVPDGLSQFMFGDSKDADMAEALPAMAPLLNRVTRAAFIEPRIVDEPSKDDEISLEDVAMADKLFIFQWLMEGAAGQQAGTFPEEQARNLAAVRDGTDVQPTT